MSVQSFIVAVVFTTSLCCFNLPSCADTGENEGIARLNTSFAEFPVLEGVTATHTGGIITLQGDVPNQESSDFAQRIAAHQQPTKLINNEIRTTSSLMQRLRPALENSIEQLSYTLAYLPLLLIALIIVFGFWNLARLVKRWNTPFEKLSSNAFLSNLMQTLASTAVILTGILFALEILDATALVGAVLGTAGIAGLALGLAFRDTVENYIAGLLLSIRQPFVPFDAIAIDDIEGQVVRMTSRATILMSYDGNHVRIPNAKVFQGTLVNYSRNPTRRFDFSVGVSTNVDLSAAQTLAVETLLGIEAVLDDPKPSSLIETLGDSNVILTIFGWVDQREYDFKKTRSQAIRMIKEAFDRAEYEMPEPIYRLRLNHDASDALLETQSENFTQESVTLPEKTSLDAQRIKNLSEDIRPDTTISEHIREERRRDKDDLLDADAPRE